MAVSFAVLNDLLLGMGKKELIGFEKARLDLMLKELGLNLQSVVDIIGKKSFSVERMKQVNESGEATEQELKWLAGALKANVYDFFLPVDESDKLIANLEFRVPPGIGISHIGIEAHFAIRRMKQLRNRVLDLDPDINPVNLSWLYSSEAESSAKKFIEYLGQPKAVLKQLRKSDKRIKELLRPAIEKMGVLTYLTDNFKGTAVPLEQMRGCVIIADLLPAIIVNGADNINAQAFTILHELGHLIAHNRLSNQSLETWCNRFASEVLVPDSDLRPFVEQRPRLSNDDLMTQITREFAVSRLCAFVCLGRYRDLDWNDRPRYYKEPDREKTEKGQSGGGPDRTVVLASKLPLMLKELAWKKYAAGWLSLLDVQTITGLKNYDPVKLSNTQVYGE